VVIDGQAAHAGRDRDAGHERDQRPLLLGEARQHARERTEPHRNRGDDLALVEALGHRHPSSHLERSDEDREPDSEDHGVRRDDRDDDGRDDRDRGEPQREDDPALGRGRTQPRLDDDREGQLAGKGGNEHRDGEEALFFDREQA
jgi:hypothetical protein